MNIKQVAILSLGALPLLVLAAGAQPGRGNAQGTTLPSSAAAVAVRAATEQFKDVEAAKAAGYALLHGCVSGPTEGAMGIHFANGNLVADGLLDFTKPEALLYEVRNGQYELVGVEYVVIADDWNARNQAPPVLMGQLFNYVSAPNRFGIPAFYELHVWAWRTNPRGTFADWNPTVSCDDYTAAGASHEGGY
jgi:hypothetical protein